MTTRRGFLKGTIAAVVAAQIPGTTIDQVLAATSDPPLVREFMDNGWVRITERFTINGVKYISSCFVRGDYEKAAISFPDEGLAHIDAGGGDLEIMDVSLKYDQEDIPAHNPALWSDAPTKWVVSNGSVTAGQR